jgi:hypothetical protein
VGVDRGDCIGYKCKGCIGREVERESVEGCESDTE